MNDKPRRSGVHPTRRFHDWQVWPGSYDNPPATALPRPAPPGPRINPAAPLAGLGSCFIREMKTRLSARGVRFIAEEAHDPAARHGSAAWERLYNLASVRQVVEYALTDAVPSPRWWTCPQSGMIQDPYRRIVTYPDLATAQTRFAEHRRAARRALVKARTLLVSLDYTEIWEDVRSGAVVCLPSGPYVDEGGDMSPYVLRVMAVQDCLGELERIHDLVLAANPGCRLLLALSPVQQWVTFRPGVDVFSASFSAKATLRVAAEAFAAERPNVHLFPAYETAMLLRPSLGRSIFAEGRENFHVSAETLDAVADAFFRLYIDD